MKIQISTDSTADLPKNLASENNIKVIPLTILYQGKEYRDGIDITEQEIYKILEESEELPVSSQVHVQRYLELFQECVDEGVTDLIHISINAKGSGTYQAALLALNTFFEEHPEYQSVLNVTVIDSRTYSMTYGMVCVIAAQAVKEGKSKEEIIDIINDYLDHARPMFVPLTLKCVRKSGRISGFAAFVGEALGLKPLISFEKGGSVTITKMRGEKKAVKEIVNKFLTERDETRPYVMVYGNNMETYGEMRDLVFSSVEQRPMCEYPVGCIIGINTGPNMMGIIYFSKEKFN